MSGRGNAGIGTFVSQRPGMVHLRERSVLTPKYSNKDKVDIADRKPDVAMTYHYYKTKTELLGSL